MTGRPRQANHPRTLRQRCNATNAIAQSHGSLSHIPITRRHIREQVTAGPPIALIAIQRIPNPSPGNFPPISPIAPHAMRMTIARKNMSERAPASTRSPNCATAQAPAINRPTIEQAIEAGTNDRSAKFSTDWGAISRAGVSFSSSG